MNISLILFAILDPIFFYSLLSHKRTRIPSHFPAQTSLLSPRAQHFQLLSTHSKRLLLHPRPHPHKTRPSPTPWCAYSLGFRPLFLSFFPTLPWPLRRIPAPAPRTGESLILPSEKNENTIVDVILCCSFSFDFFSRPNTTHSQLVFLLFLLAFSKPRNDPSDIGLKKTPPSHVLCQPAMLKWLSYRTMFNLFIKKYRHEISFAHTTHYRVTMEYESRGFNTHCHEDGQFCVTHGDPMSPEMATWYKGYNYQHNTVTSNCEDTEFCAVYMDIIGSK